jgi:hypothetical protein
VAPLPERRALSPLEFEPEVLARDLVQALGLYSPADARAILAGYARAGYEMLDHRSVGVTDAVLDHLRIARWRPRPQEPAFDVPRVLRALGVKLELAQSRDIVALPIRAEGANPWMEQPHAAFQVVLALLVAGVGCSALFARDSAAFRQGSRFELYRMLCPDHRIGSDPAAAVARIQEDARGIELAVGLGQVLRNSQLAEPFDFNQVLFWARQVLVTDGSEQPGLLADVLIDVAWRCAHLVAEATGDARNAESYAQKAVIFLEYVARGGEDDETRLVRLWHELRALEWTAGTFDSPSDVSRLGIMNSLLLTHRELAERAVAAQTTGRAGTLRSAALRGVQLARRALRFAYAASGSRDPDVAASAFMLLRLTIKNYARLLVSLHHMAQVEQQATRASAWLSFFDFGPSPSLLARELSWIAHGLEAAAQDGYSLDNARTLIRACPLGPSEPVPARPMSSN